MSNDGAEATIEEQLRAVRQVYARDLPHKIRAIEATWNRLLQGKWDLEVFKTLHRMTHSLAGSGASFGFAAVSDVARILERLAKSIVETAAPPTGAQQSQITSYLEALKWTATEENQNIPVNKLGEYIRKEHSPRPGGDNRLIFLVEDDQDLAQDLALQIGYFGYTVRIFPQLAGLKRAIDQTPPGAIVTDVIFSEGDLAGIETIAEIQQARETLIPVIFISIRDDLTARLQAVRAGGCAYLTKPIDVGVLLDRLNLLTTNRTPEPHRVLIVEDDAPLAAHYAFILQQAGMDTTVVAAPMKMMQLLVDFSPDLILMDVYMDECDGRELASVIRQQDAYVGVPIVFLSRETDPNKQLAALHLGGDDFLTKPIGPEHLISAVKSRVERAQTLRSFMVRDSLTGLLNHTTTKRQLSIEVARARRRNAPLAFAMIDIDHFKSVNDTYGHITGDRILKNLSQLLPQRLRRTDVIGRYGGEEFAIVLPDTDGPTAVKVLDEIRAGFAQVRHQHEDTSFFVTFSCGIAGFPDYETESVINEATDRALYAAKREGRNRVALAND